MNTGTLLRAQANGVNPDTGELLRPASAACAPEVIRLLFALASEFDGEAERQKSPADVGGEAAEESGRGAAGQCLLPLAGRGKAAAAREPCGRGDAGSAER